MKCSNCGSELKNGTKICPRCGARQKDNANNNSNTQHSHFSGKVIGIVLSLVAVMAISVFVFTRVTKDTIASDFTNNINFDNSKFTVRDENTVVLREVDEKLAFSVDSDEDFIDATVKNELDEKIDIVISKTKDDRFLIAPKDKWSNEHTYYLVLNGNTFFTDEQLYQFNKVIYTIKRQDVATYKYNDNIKNLVKSPELETIVGDIVIIKDETGQSICRKVKSKDGNNTEYELPDLTEVFEEMDLHTSIKPDLSEYFKNPSVQNEIMMNFVNSELFDAFVMTTYAESKDKLELYKSEKEKGLIKDIVKDDKSIGRGLANNLEVKLAIKDTELFGDIEVKFNPVTKSDGTNGFKLELGRKDKDKKTDENYTHEIGNKEKVSFEFLFGAPDMVVDVGWGKTNKNNARFNTYASVKTSMEINIEYSNYNKQEWENSYKEAYVYLKEKLYNRKRKMESESESGGAYSYFKLFKLPIPLPVPCVVAYFEGTCNPSFLIEGELAYNYKTVNIWHGGLQLDTSDNGGFKKDEAGKFPDVDYNEHKISFEAAADFELPFTVKAGIQFCVLDDVPKTGIAFIDWIAKKAKDIAPAANVDLYFTWGGCIKLEGKIDTTFKSNQPMTLLEQAKENSNINVSIGVGMPYDIGVEAYIKILTWQLSGTESIAKDTYYFIKYNFIDKKATSSEIPALQTCAFTVPNPGEEVEINGVMFVVLEKDDENALIVTEQAIECKQYNEYVAGKDSVAYAWSDSTLRDWLNDKDGFLKDFQKGGLNYIVKKEVPYAGEDKNGNSSKDKVYILSEEELNKYTKEFEKFTKTAKATERAQNHKVEEKDGNVRYWLRDNGAGGMQWNIKYVDYDGSIKGIHSTEEGVGVRPCMWIRHNVRQISEENKEITKGKIIEKQTAYSNVNKNTGKTYWTPDTPKTYIGASPN